MSVVPTTVSSNVVMTGQAGGDEAASTTEVIIGNLIGVFLSPALLEMFFASSRWEFGRPDAGRGGGIGEVYRKVIEQVSSQPLVFFACPTLLKALSFPFSSVTPSSSLSSPERSFSTSGLDKQSSFERS